MVRVFVILLGLSAVILLLLTAFHYLRDRPSTDQFRLGSGGERGSYYAFAEELTSELTKHGSDRLVIENVPTAGSVDNLDRISRGTLEFAIVQSDIGHNIYYGRGRQEKFSGFLAALPLFDEFIQVLVSTDSGILTFRDLEGSVISVGPAGSGGYQNALEILSSVGLHSGINFREVNLPIHESLEGLASGDIQAVIYTSASLPPQPVGESAAFRHLPLPAGVIKTLSEQLPYYEASTLPGHLTGGQGPIPSLSVTAYLVSGRSVSPGNTERLVGALLKRWPYLRSQDGRYDLADLSEKVRRSPFPRHSGAERALEKAGFLTSNRSFAYAGFGILAAMGLLYWARRRRAAYDRLGNFYSYSGSFEVSVLRALDRSNLFVVIALVFFGVVLGLVWIILLVEENYATINNVDNRFLDFNYVDAFVWMFTFMGSGYTDDVFPLSTPGKFLATILPFIGLSTIIGYVFVASDRLRLASAEAKRGTQVRPVKDHIVLCGWHERAEHLVYALTSKDAPQKKRIVVVAEFADDMPLERFNFDPKFVQYCRGNGGNHQDLKTANIGDAAGAVILSHSTPEYSHNASGVFSAMAITALRGDAGRGADGEVSKDDFFVVAEATHTDNVERFERMGVNTVYSGDLLVDRLLAQAALNERVFDFMLDSLTYDAFSELHSMKVSEIETAPGGSVCNILTSIGLKVRAIHPIARRAFKVRPLMRPDWKSFTYGQLQAAMLPTGVNLVAVSGGRRRSGLLAPLLDEKSAYKLLLSATAQRRRPAEEDVILYFSNEERDLPWGLAGFVPPRAGDEPKRPLIVERPQRQRVALVGDARRCDEIALLLECLPWVECIKAEVVEGSDAALSISFGDGVEEALSKCDDLQAVIILPSRNHHSGEQASKRDKRDFDARTVFIAWRIREIVASKCAVPPRIVGEMKCVDNRQLFADAGISVGVTEPYLMERVIAKLMFSKGYTCDFLLGLTAFEDGVYLHSVCVGDDDTHGFIGLTFEEAVMSTDTGFQLLGWLPSERHPVSGKLFNKIGDYGWHFVTAPTAYTSGQKIGPGDLLMFAVEGSSWDQPATAA